ncbi:MAG: EAL domain-containing protein, partial [Firmicutes bacterium]|nr:EAL domain-containing protein [Bacillota bacterium]
MKRSSPDKVSYLGYFLVFLISVSVMFAAVFIIISSIRGYYYEHMESDVRQITVSYTSRLKTAIAATEIINNLMNEKIETASQMVSRFKDEISNEELNELAKTIAADVIYIYDKNGEVIYSTTGEFIGWRPHEKHPVYAYMESGEKRLVEDIRADLETGVYYKFGYYTADDGQFVQIGILAEKIYEFLANFEIQRLLDEIAENKSVEAAYFFDTYMNVTANSFCEWDLHFSDAMLEIIQSGNEHRFDSSNLEKNVHTLAMPVFVDGSRIGSLVIEHNTEETDALIKTLTFIGNTALIVIFFLVFAATFSAYVRNKNLAYYAYHNNSTGLPNKRYFDEYLNHELAQPLDGKKAIILINLKNFKRVSMLSGYHYGEKLIQDMGDSLMLLESDNRRLFHLYSDIFLIYVKGYKTKNDLEDLCDAIPRVLRELATSYSIKGGIGVAEAEGFFGEATILLKNASLAARQSSENEIFSCCFFDKDMDSRLRREEAIIEELNRAVYGGDSLYLEYQPIIDLKTNRIYGFEALARLRCDKLGIVPPSEFIPIAERTLLIVPLGNKIFRMASCFIKRMQEEGFRDIRVSINISGIQLLRGDFNRNLMEIIKECEINSSNIDIEITESVFSNNYSAINNKLLHLRESGMRVAVDDFGMGYSSLARQTELNINCLKIDKYFVNKILTGNENNILVGDIISMSHKLGHFVVAEGV